MFPWLNVHSPPYGVRAAAVDGNVLRVVSRLRAVAAEAKHPVQGCDACPSSVSALTLRSVTASRDASRISSATPAVQHTHHTRVVCRGGVWCAGDWNQAMMELGATLCAPTTSPHTARVWGGGKWDPAALPPPLRRHFRAAACDAAPRAARDALLAAGGAGH
eukprot:gene3910-biopygen38020